MSDQQGGEVRQAPIIVIHGPDGGGGKTTVALHMAYLLAAEGVPTLLVDLSQYGAMGPWLRLPRGGSSGVAGLAVALQQGGVSLTRLWDGMVAAPGCNEQLFLILSSGPVKMDQMTAAQTQVLLRHLAGAAGVVLVDTGNELTERVLGALMAADKIVLTLPPRVVSGWQALDFLEILRSLYVPRDRLALLFNRVTKGARHGVEEYQQTLDLPVLGVIPESADLQEAAESGRPIAARARTPGVMAIRQALHQLIPDFQPKELRPWWRLSK